VRSNSHIHPVPEQTVEQQIADAIAELENGLAAQMMW
jgi:hypothetical protein